MKVTKTLLTEPTALIEDRELVLIKLLEDVVGRIVEQNLRSTKLKYISRSTD